MPIGGIQNVLSKANNTILFLKGTVKLDLYLDFTENWTQIGDHLCTLSAIQTKILIF